MLRVRMLYWDQGKSAQVEVGSFVLQKGKVVVVPVEPDGRRVLGNILKRKLRVDDEGQTRIGVEAGAERWMRQLPRNYDGAQARAKLEE